MSENELKISIITASYNYAELIKETIESVLAQTYQNWELIVVDDGSKDNSVEVIRSYCEKDSRIKLLQHENGQNKGLIKTIQAGLEYASSDWIAFLESDDIWTSDYLEEKVKVINSADDAKFIFNDVEFFGDKTQIQVYDEYMARRKTMLSGDKISYIDFFRDNPVQTFSCVMLKKELISSCDFNAASPQNVDWYLWSQILVKTKLHYIEKDLTRWRIHPTSYINTMDRHASVNNMTKILNILDEYRHSKIWSTIYKLINTPKLEKLFRPQVKFMSDIIIRHLLKDKARDIIHI
jgi:glycosyltransferase involved in cell wall biosynthesis